MVNGLQRVIYNLGNAVPLAVMTALAWYIEFKTWPVMIVLFICAAIETILFAVCFCYAKNNCAVKSINVSKIISRDSWNVAYVIAYVLPFACITISNYHIVLFIVAVLMCGFCFIPAIMALPNILLFLVGYHFYEIETDNTGVGDYMLISKRCRIRNKADVKKVKRIFEKLLIDAKEED